MTKMKHGPVAIKDVAARSVHEPWPEFDSVAARAELRAAGWKQPGEHGRTVWQSPSGKLYRGPALAWKLLRKYGDQC